MTQGLRCHHVGLQVIGKVVRVWFYHLLLGAFRGDGNGKFERYLPEEDEPVQASTPATSSEQALICHIGKGRRLRERAIRECVARSDDQ